MEGLSTGSTTCRHLREEWAAGGGLSRILALQVCCLKRVDAQVVILVSATISKTSPTTNEFVLVNNNIVVLIYSMLPNALLEYIIWNT